MFYVLKCVWSFNIILSINIQGHVVDDVSSKGTLLEFFILDQRGVTLLTF